MANVTPGLNKDVYTLKLNEDERQIVRRLAQEWRITRGVQEARLGTTSAYRYLLMKPTDVYSEMFNLDREIIVVLSPYTNFEPRTLDVIGYVAQQFSELRLEEICSVVISRDQTIGDKLRELLKGNQESQVVVPFSIESSSNQVTSTLYVIDSRNIFIPGIYLILRHL